MWLGCAPQDSSSTAKDILTDFTNIDAGFLLAFAIGDQIGCAVLAQFFQGVEITSVVRVGIQPVSKWLQWFDYGNGAESIVYINIPFGKPSSLCYE